MGDISLSRALEEYKEVYLASRNYSQRTRVEYLNDIEDLIHFLQQLGLKDAKDIGLPQLERYLAELDHRGNAGSTRKRKVISIRSFLWYLCQERYIRVDLAKKLIPPFSETRSIRYLTGVEYERLLGAASCNHRDYALLQLLLQTGIKLLELTRLTTNDVDLSPSQSISDSGFLRISRSESKGARTISLNFIASNALRNFLKERSITKNMSLFANRFGEPLGSRGVEKILKKYLDRVGIMKANIQSLRHTFGVYQIANGVDPATIQEIMGNKSPQSILPYIAVVREMKYELLDIRLPNISREE